MKAIPLDIIGNCDTPDETIETWYNMFLPVANKHAVLRSKRVRNKKAPKTLVSIPVSDITCFIHREIVSLDARPCGAA